MAYRDIAARRRNDLARYHRRTKARREAGLCLAILSHAMQGDDQGFEMLGFQELHFIHGEQHARTAFPGERADLREQRPQVAGQQARVAPSRSGVEARRHLAGLR